MKSKQYIFTYEEMIVLREALVEYELFIKPQGEEPASEKRQRTAALAAAMHDQFKNDVRLFRESI